jgi:ribosomal protein S18 acetylase RimI-like enzyme
MAEPHAQAVDVSRVTVVRLGEEDWAAYRAVRLEMLLDAPLAFGGTHAESAARPEAGWRERLRIMPTWLAMDGGAEPLGAVSLFRFPEQDEDEACLIAMWVRPSARGRGVADLLLEAAVRHAAESGWRRVTLDVAEGNVHARALYERQGFRPTGRTGVLPSHPTVRELEMAREL